MSKPIIKITRYWQDENQTLGNLVLLGDNDKPLFTAVTLERGWRNNQQGISCIPKNNAPYSVVLEYSNKFKTDLFEIKSVPNRSECKFHAANFWRQLNGCIALGINPTDIDGDGYIDVTSSKATMKRFHKAMEPYTSAILIITGKPNIL